MKEIVDKTKIYCSQFELFANNIFILKYVNIHV